MEKVESSLKYTGITKGKLFVVSAPSGCGKTTLVRSLVDKVSIGCALKRVITYTTKKPRPGEVDGKDYHFLSISEFRQKIEQGFFIEYSTCYGNYYGSPSYILKDVEQGSSYIMIVDRLGAKQISLKLEASILIWIYPKDIKDLEYRLRSRNADAENEILERMRIAKAELAEENAENFFRYHILNDEFEDALFELVSVVENELKLIEKTP